MTRITAKELKKLGLEPKRKYNNRKTNVDGIKFDSIREADYYYELKLRQRAGEVQSFRCQPEYELLPSFTVGNSKKRPITYKADFEVTLPDGKIQVVDVKGVKTKEYMLKRKLFMFKYPQYEFLEVH